MLRHVPFRGIVNPVLSRSVGYVKLQPEKPREKSVFSSFRTERLYIGKEGNSLG